jgi:putative phosphoserine phosphatase/1-acylglycerol-3-phosphate O-acyltransferase
MARSVAAMGGILTGLGTGAVFGLLNGSRRTAISSMMALSAEYSLALAGVRVDIVGEHHVWEQRPAVFVFNHQSQLDVFVICYLLRRDFTGVAKQELTKDPIFGPVFRFAGVAFVDRQGGGDPRAALAPAVEKLHDGISVVIAPEGTRSLTPTLGEFKTGAFHLAREAGVPVVPIVIRNAGELMWRDSLTVRPGTVQVAVLPPIDVSAWPADQVRNKTREVQALFADTLAHWPGEPRPAPKDPVPPKKTSPPRKAPPAKKAVTKKTVTKKSASPRRRTS